MGADQLELEPTHTLAAAPPAENLEASDAPAACPALHVAASVSCNEYDDITGCSRPRNGLLEC